MRLEQAIESIVRKEMTFEGMKTVVIPVPIVLPLGVEVDASGVQMVWDTYIKPGQAAGNPQSVEERCLMAILRAVNVGLETGPIIDAK